MVFQFFMFNGTFPFTFSNIRDVSSIFRMFQTIYKSFFEFLEILHVEIRGGVCTLFLEIFYPDLQKFSGLSV